MSNDMAGAYFHVSSYVNFDEWSDEK